MFDHVGLAVQDLDALIGFYGARENPPGDEPPEIGIGFEQCAEHPKTAFARFRRRDMLQHEIEQGRHAFPRPVRASGHPALFRRTVKDRKIELFVGGVERREKIEDLVYDLVRAGIGSIDLVHRDDRPQTDFQRLADDEFGLRHRPFGGIDQDDRAIDHGQDALHLAAEVGVARRIDDVDPRVLPCNRRRLGDDRDPALLFEIVRIHDPLGDPLILAEGAGLLEQAVHERRLAVIDVSDNGDIAQLHFHANQIRRVRTASRSYPTQTTFF